MFGMLKLDLPGMDWPLGVPDLDEYMYQKESPFSGTGPWLALSDPTSDAAHGKFAEVDGKLRNLFCGRLGCPMLRGAGL